jgi:hypothetical protein
MRAWPRILLAGALPTAPWASICSSSVWLDSTPLWRTRPRYRHRFRLLASSESPTHTAALARARRVAVGAQQQPALLFGRAAPRGLATRSNPPLSV